MGQFTGELCVTEHSLRETIFVVRGLKNELLGLPALAALQLVQKLDATHSSNDVMKEFPKVFTGLGNFGELYDIQLKDDAKPRALFTPRNVPVPLWDKVKKEFDRMESLGVISPVVVPKRSGDVCIVWILKHLTKA